MRKRFNLILVSMVIALLFLPVLSLLAENLPDLSIKRTHSGMPPFNFKWVDFNSREIKVKRYKIGFSQMTLDHPARKYMDSRFHEYAKKMGVKAITTDANWIAAREVSNVKALIAQKCDGIIISSHAGLGIKPAVDACARAGIPVVLFDGGQPQADWKFACWAATDDWQLGRRAGYYMCTQIGGEGEIAQLQGTPGSSVVDGRRDGILTALDDFPKVKIVADVTTNWQRVPSIQATKDIVTSHPNLKAIITHCDEQAIGAALALRELGRNSGPRKILIFSVSDSEKEAFDLIKTGEIMLTQDYVQDGAIPLNLMLQILEGMKVPRIVNLGTAFVTKETVSKFKPIF